MPLIRKSIREKIRHSTDIGIINFTIPQFWFSSNIVEVRLFEQKGADVMSTNANDQLIL